MKLTKRQLGTFAIIFSIALVTGLAIGLYDPLPKSNTLLAVTHNDTVNLVIRNPQNQVIYNYTTHNLLTSLGSHFIILQMEAGSTTNESVYMVLSTDATPLVSWTALPSYISTNGLGITAALTPTTGSCTTANGLSWYYTVTNTWTATGTQTGIVCMGLEYTSTGSSSSDNLVAAASISSASVISGDTLQGTWNVTVPCG